MDLIEIYLKEDLGEEGDITTNAILGDEEGEGIIIANVSCVLAGIEDAGEVFSRLGANFRSFFKDGDEIEKGTIVARVKGKLRSILAGERVALNILSRMSGIASETRDLVEMCRRVNPRIEICATRKTTPGFRKYEKKAVIIGGGCPHRFGLFDAVLIKDNHIKAVGSVEEAIRRVKERVKGKTIEVEVENEEDAIKAARLGVDWIMLDNIPASRGKEIAEKIRSINPNIGIEASGGINRKNIIEYARFADRISLGYITHSVKSKDFSLEIEKH
ncbi:MAG TPA: carboxylating nicotinate-nucleotide diphosphorylase [Thermoplasmatales archaeon]|nr:carboxylating nicotinate-nucleotide diphosphorylase [Thermoplasmatales archaeon]HEX17054.1 carboxylating nicotinate-nucleotide diphosphorylase [Thermoplasmatales archaeon]